MVFLLVDVVVISFPLIRWFLWGIAYHLLNACAGGDALGQLDGDYGRDGLCCVILI